MGKRKGSYSPSCVEMCAACMYKRRKLQNSIALLPDLNATERSNGCCSCKYSSNFGCDSLIMQKDSADWSGETLNVSVDQLGHVTSLADGNAPSSSPPDSENSISILGSRANGNMNLDSFSKTQVVNCSFVGEERKSADASVNNFEKLTDSHSLNESCSSLKSHLEHHSALVNIQVEDAGDHSSSGSVAVKPLTNFTSAKELCIYVLKTAITTCAPGSALPNSTCVPPEVHGGKEDSCFAPCKLCGLTGNPQNMLICDLCEEAFHLHCCRAKKPFSEDWYCQLCTRKKTKPLLDAASEKLLSVMSEKSRRKILQRGLGPVLSMLRDTGPYTSGVRISKEFQADVPEWSGPLSEDYDCFGEPSELDPAECDSLNRWSLTNSLKPCSIGNWIQCTEVRSDGVICGKWRRAPLFVTQTGDWDCSCSVVWDPIHADCAVPQEMETEEVLKQLEYVDLLRARVVERQNQKRGSKSS